MEGKRAVADQLEQRIARLSPEQRDVFEKRVQGRFAAEIKPPVIVPLKGPGPWPLSFAQQRLWFLDQLVPGNAFYNIPLSVRLRGELQRTALESAFKEVMRRHEVFRTRFVVDDGLPCQVIEPSCECPLPIRDLSHLPAPEQESEVRGILLAEATRLFDLSRGPLLRTALLRLDPDDHILLFTVHHIAADGWSIGVLVREISTLYAAFVEGKSSPLPELPVRYADFAVWERQWLKGAAFEELMSYWTTTLSDLPEFELPPDLPRPAMLTFRGASETVRISMDVTRRLRSLAKSEGVTFFMVLVGALDALLHRSTGCEDIVIGTPMANRTQPETRELIGFFVNTLVLRTAMGGNPSFLEVLERVRRTTSEAYAHQELPFEQLVEHLQPERNLNRNPLFQINLQFQDPFHRGLELPGLEVVPSGTEVLTTHFDLEFHPREADGCLEIMLVYSTDLYQPSTARRMLHHFEQLTKAIAEAPDKPIGEHAFLTSVERHELLKDFNQTQISWNDEGTIPAMVERQVCSAPDSVALVSDDRHFSYSVVNATANQVADYLVGKGVGADVRVAICLERSAEMVLTVLAILKAGGTYVPLDPAYPAARLAYMLQDSGASVVVGNKLKRYPVFEEMRGKVSLEEDWPSIAASSADNPDLDIPPDSLAYVIYTSGSTGTPKGIGLPHRALLNLLQWYTSSLQHGLRTLQFSSISFDASFHEIFLTWITGGTLVMVADNRDIAELARICSEQAIEKIILPAAVLPHFIADLSALCGSSDCLREIISNAEQLQIDPEVRRWFRDRNCKLLNHYGPSETHVATAYPMPNDVNGWSDRPPIGRPIANTQAYILDRELNPLPRGAIGELYLGGTGIARGYIDDPGLTAERFLPDCLGAGHGDRLYKTGDLARYLPDGNIEYLGRVDTQLKIRGFRVEPGEIEAVLAQHKGIREAAVVASGEAGSDRHLVAHVVPVSVSPPTRSELKSWLAGSLPEHMIPSGFVFLKSLPLTPTGKLDRKALVRGDWRPQVAERTYVAPRTPLEDLLAGIWAEVLRLPRIGIHDNFFELGGHSLLATQVVSRIRSVMHLELPLRTLFEARTISELAKHVEAGSQGKQPQQPIQPCSRDRIIPLSFGQERLWFLNQLHPGASYNLPAVVHLTGELRVEVLSEVLFDLVRRHESLRTTFGALNGSPFQVINPAARIELPVIDMADLRPDLREKQIEEIVQRETEYAFDLSRGPLLRVTLVRLAQSDHIVVFNMHHIVSDGWSMAVLIREVGEIYAARVGGAVPQAPELPVQYADYAVWQREWLKGEVLRSLLAYWRQQLEGAPGILTLPTDHPRQAIQRHQGAVHTFQLGAELVSAAREISRSRQSTLFMTLLAAWQILLARYGGQQEVVVGIPIANRTRSETEQVIGFFVNTLAIRTRLGRRSSFAEILDQVRDVALGAYTHQDLPFEKLVQELQPDRDMSRSPLVQVLFSFQNTPAAELKLPGLSMKPVPFEGSTAKFDLTLAVCDANDSLMATLEYDRDLFEPSTAQRLSANWQTLLAAAIEDPNANIWDLPIVASSELQDLLQVRNATNLEYCPWEPAARLFEKSVQLRPDAIAVVCKDEHFNYDGLNRRANQLASYLKNRGVAPEVPVGLCFERSVEALVGMLGVLKAGAAYVPLDPGLPAERLAFVLEDAQVTFLLTQKKLLDSLPSHWAQVICLDTDWPLISCEPDADAQSQVEESGLAYVIYTSGSTGRPKGVAVTHAGFSNYLNWSTATYLNSSSCMSLVHSSLGVDLTITSIFPPLLNGGTLILLPSEGDIEDLARAFRNNPDCLLKLTPSHLGALRVLLDSRSPISAAPCLVVGGEALFREEVCRWRTLVPHMRLINEYGPTETVVGCCVSEVAAGVAGTGPVPIGRPIANTQAYVLDEQMRPVPVGVPGELYLSGYGVARGYLNRPDLTAERFVPNPFGNNPGDRLYRTGDRVRHLFDGNMEFLGRLDDQVKIRGYRVELGEIESTLQLYGKVRQSVALLRTRGAGDQQLIAYLVADEKPTDGELRSFIGSRLPGYMMPSRFIILDDFPLTVSGKLDRDALLRLAEDTGPEDQQGTGPRDELELQLTEIWEEVLASRSVGVRSNFFQLGGHSLLAVQLVTLIRTRLGLRVPVESVFLAPTVESLADRIREQGERPLWKPVLAIQPHGNKPPFFCVPPLGFSVVQYRDLASHLGSEQPFYSFQAGPVEEPSVEGGSSLAGLASKYVAAMREIQSDGPYHVGGWSSGGVMAFEMAQQLKEAGQEVGVLALFDTWAPGSRRKRDETELLAWLIAGFARQRGQETKLSLNELRGLSQEGQFNLAVQEIARSGMAGQNVNESWLSDMLRRVIGNHSLAYNYEGALYPGRISLFRASELLPDDQRDLQQEGIDLGSRIYQYRGWEPLTSEPLQVYDIPAVHIHLMTEPHVATLARFLGNELERATRPDHHKQSGVAQ
jgi:amino acid adenylation domain-containing protein